MNLRVGMGYDVHKLAENRKLILGGVHIPYIMGLVGHSDADVLLHSIIDSLLGASANGDIGKHFPDTDSKYKDVDSLKLLSLTFKILKNDGYEIINIDSTIVAQNPKLLPYIDMMVTNISNVLELPLDCINIKATTEEGLGFTGNGLGISAKCICMLNKVGK
jgi:2-C-methyl-D-erythritol 2,4-cyclodiphosphate synthase